MKISIDGEELFTLTEIQKKVIRSDIHDDIFDEDMKRRVKWVLEHKYERCMERLKAEWLPILAERMDSIPTSDEKLAEIICSQHDYKCRKDRDDDAEKKA